MKSKILILLALTTLLFSCRPDNLNEVLRTSKTPKLDLLYHSVIKAEMEEFGYAVAIVDRTLDTTSTSIDGIEILYGEKGKSIYWKKSIFPLANYISGDSLHSYKSQGQTEKYWNLRKKYKAGWIELTVPYFTDDKKKAVIEVSYFLSDSFATSHYYLLEWNGKEYQIIKKEMISIS